MNTTITSEIIPDKTVHPVAALRFPYLPGVSAKVKAIGFWWAPAPTTCWFIPERVRNARARAMLVVSAERILREAGLTIIDAAGLIPAATVLLASTNTEVSPVATLVASLEEARQQAVRTGRVVVTATQNSSQVTAQQTAGRAVRVPGQQERNLNAVVDARRVAQLRAGEGQRNRAQREVPPTPLAERTVYLLQSFAQITSNGQTLRLRAEDFERVRDFLECPLDNSFHQELKALHEKRSAYLDRASQKGYHLSSRFPSRIKEAVVRWEAADLFLSGAEEEEFQELNDEFEGLSRALGVGGVAALNHTGCTKCAPRKAT